jgi:hypothetical protein
LADFAKQYLDTRRGILSAKTSTLTGSITVYYDPSQITTLDILETLTEGGVVSDKIERPLHSFRIAPDKGIWFLAKALVSLLPKTQLINHPIGLVCLSLCQLVQN